ncbi:hypothetical protein LCGC14_0389330 [marine sediment metagenome]|uniref:Uncharacterized protein n=1 Tax=marine sediment metagenome TaxID=412755 RepID=A0A0F9VLZ8_9ZZZZ
MTDTPTARELREHAKVLEDRAHALDRAELKGHEKFMVAGNVQDSRPLVSGPYTFDEAKEVCDRMPKGVMFICDYRGPLP